MSFRTLVIAVALTCGASLAVATAAAEDGATQADAPVADVAEALPPQPLEAATDTEPPSTDSSAAGLEAAPATPDESGEPSALADPEAVSPPAAAMADADSPTIADAGASSIQDAEVSDLAALPEPVEQPPAMPASGIAGSGSFELGPEGLDAEGRRGRVHTVAPGHTLWDISDAYLGTPWVWPSVWRDNRTIENPHLIRPGDRIWITANEMRLVSEREAQELIDAELGADASVAAVEAIEDAVPESEDAGQIEELAASAAEITLEEPAAAPVEPAPVPVAPARVVRVNWLDNMSFVSQSTLEASSSIVESPSPRVWLSELDPVFIGLGEGEVQVGDQFSVFREAQPVRALDSAELLGYHVEILGWIEIEEVRRETAVGRVRMSVAEMARGDRVTPRVRAQRDVPVKLAPSGVDARIVFMPSHRTMAGSIDYMYIDRGRDHGLEVGSELEVFESGAVVRDAARGTEVMTPDVVVAKLLVVSAEPETAVVLVLKTMRELELGDSVRGVAAHVASR